MIKYKWTHYKCQYFVLVTDWSFFNVNQRTKLKKLQSVTKTKYWHTIFSQLFSFTLRYKLFKWILSKPSVFAYCVCIWSFGRTRSSKCTLLVCFGARRAHTHTHARANTPTHTRARKHTRIHTSAWGTASLVWIVLSTFYYQTCPAIYQL